MKIKVHRFRQRAGSPKMDVVLSITTGRWFWQKVEILNLSGSGTVWWNTDKDPWERCPTWLEMYLSGLYEKTYVKL